MGLEDDAEEIWAYDPKLIHGLLQTPGYVCAMLSVARPTCKPADLERSVDLRQARMLFDRRPESLPSADRLGERVNTSAGRGWLACLSAGLPNWYRFH